MTIEDVVKILKSSERVGAAVDIPEGSRMIQISDTLAGKMIEALTVKVPVAVKGEVVPITTAEGRSHIK